MAAATRVAEIEKLENESFTKGAQVEVSLEEPGFRGSWYTATVIRPVFKKTRKLLLEFHTLRADDKSSKPLRETVNIILARPLPPRESNRRRFHLSEEVDAFHNDGWWEGVVTAVRAASDRCSVFFRCSREEIEFPAEDLRLHREWVYGKWVPPLENENNEDDDGGEVSGEQ